MKKPLVKCCNGCDAPPKPPSWVLCAACFGKLDKQIRALCGEAGTVPKESSTTCDPRWNGDSATIVDGMRRCMPCGKMLDRLEQHVECERFQAKHGRGAAGKGTR